MYAPLCILSCAECNIVFAVTEQFEARCRKDHKTFYCPSGHELEYPGVSDKDRAKNLQKKLWGCKTQHAAIERSNAALRGVITKLKKKGDKK